MSSTLITFIDYDSETYIYKEKKNIIKNIYERVKIWNISNIKEYYGNTYILIEVDNLFLSSTHNIIYFSTYPSFESLWITSYNIYNLSVPKELRHLNFDKYITNIYGKHLSHINSVGLSNIYNSNNLYILNMQNIDIKNRVNIKINLIKTKYKAQLYYLKDTVKIYYKTFFIWSLIENINIESNLILVLQDMKILKFLSSFEKVYYSNKIQQNSILTVTPSLEHDYKYKSINTSSGEVLSIKNNKIVIDSKDVLLFEIK